MVRGPKHCSSNFLISFFTQHNYSKPQSKNITYIATSRGPARTTWKIEGILPVGGWVGPHSRTPVPTYWLVAAYCILTAMMRYSVSDGGKPLSIVAVLVIQYSDGS